MSSDPRTTRQIIRQAICQAREDGLSESTVLEAVNAALVDYAEGRGGLAVHHVFDLGESPAEP